ncbi:MAG TPA: cupin domain-containing protein, partial [Pseudomonadales bacterium]|nr:cupin domain-containing protein [Pseudomonadales bacterium]
KSNLKENDMARFGSISTEEFLRDYWQKKPLLVKKAFPELETVLTPEELAGIAIEEDAESRLIREDRKKHTWQLRNGPFTETDFQKLPKTHWTLLVQAVDQWMPELRSLLNEFRFLPNWRIDDIMVSYAVPHGSVGPHFDFYDVFLIQGLGTRKWSIGQYCDDQTPLLANCDLRILQRMDITEEWICEPGDMLYLPPRIAHYGIAIDPSMTWSVGFRAPSHAEILEHFCGFLSEKLGESCRYEDPEGFAQREPGWISSHTIESVQKIIRDASSNKDIVAQWFGQFMSEPKYADLEKGGKKITLKQMQAKLKKEPELLRDESSRFLYSGTEELPERLYINGCELSIQPDMAELVRYLTRERTYPAETLLQLADSEEKIELLCKLHEQGYVYFN